jgi:5'-nucleotidase
VNVPDRPVAELGPLREAKLTEIGMATITVRHHDDVDAAVLRATAEDLATVPDPESDIALLAAGHPTVTRLTSVADQPGVLHVAGV